MSARRLPQLQPCFGQACRLHQRRWHSRGVPASSGLGRLYHTMADVVETSLYAGREVYPRGRTSVLAVAEAAGSAILTEVAAFNLS